MSEDIQSISPASLGRREHNADAAGKRVVLRYQDPVTGSWNNFAPSTLVTVAWDYISANLSGSTTDVYTYKSGGSGGTTVATVTVTWTDSTKTVLSSVART